MADVASKQQTRALFLSTKVTRTRRKTELTKKYNKHDGKPVLCQRAFSSVFRTVFYTVNPLTSNVHYISRTAPLTSKHCILYIYSTNTGTEYFKNGIQSPFFYLQNAVCFVILTYLVPVLFIFYVQSVLKFKKK